MDEGEFWVAVFEGEAGGIFAEVGVFGMFLDSVVEGDEGFGQLLGFAEAGGEEADNADVLGEEFSGFAEGGDGFGGAAVLSEELAEEEEVVGVVEFGAFEEGFGEGGAEVGDGEVGEVALDELVGGALGSGGGGITDPASGEGGAGGAAFAGGGFLEFGVGDDLVGGDGAAVDCEEFAIG